MNIPEIDLTPEQQIFTNTVSYRPWYLLWLFALYIEREVLVWYTVDTMSDGGMDKTKLHANFRNNKSHRVFPNKEHAERWLGADIETSDHVGENVIIKIIPAIHTIRCNMCGYISEPADISVTVKGPETKMKGYVHVSLHHEGICEQCGSHRVVSAIVERR